MATDLALLLTPLEGTSPCGRDLLFSNDFDAIQHARRFDDPSLDQGEWVTEIKEADWDFVIDRCSALLGTQTKDLRLAAWLTEALAIKQGLAGLKQGYSLLAGLCERYWETVHPLPDGDDAEYRLGNVAWLVRRTAELLRDTRIAETSTGSFFTAADWDVATHVAQAARREPERADELARGKPSIEQIDAAKRITPTSFYRTLLDELKAFETAMLTLEARLDEYAGEAAPSFRQTKESYAFVHGLAERFARDVGVSPEPAPNAASADSQQPREALRAEPTFKTPLPQTATMPSNSEPRDPGVIRSRADAIAQLRAVAQFLRAAEPHSPAAYLADKAAEWADMPLHQWLASVVKDDGQLAHLRELLGVKPEPR